jgi:hypothetical protein
MRQVNLAVTQHLPSPFSSPFLGDNSCMTMGSGSRDNLQANMLSPTFFCSEVGPGFSPTVYFGYVRRNLESTAQVAAAVQFVQ